MNTAGYACASQACAYCGITDVSVHALVGFGHHGVDDNLQDLFCQACGHNFSVRRHTALYRLKTPAPRVAEVLAALAEGLSVAAAGRVFGHAAGTIATWLALDARTKIIAAAERGPRTRTTAPAMIHGLMRVLACGCILLFTSDGLNLYFYSLTAHFGSWQEMPGTNKRVWQVATTLLYGQLIKSYRRRKLARVARVMRWGTRADLGHRLQALGWRGVLQTAFVERVNLAIRRGLAMLARRSWATAQTRVRLQDGVAWWRG